MHPSCLSGRAELGFGSSASQNWRTCRDSAPHASTSSVRPCARCGSAPSHVPHSSTWCRNSAGDHRLMVPLGPLGFEDLMFHAGSSHSMPPLLPPRATIAPRPVPDGWQPASGGLVTGVWWPGGVRRGVCVGRIAPGG